MADLIDRAEAQTELQFAFRRYNLSHEAHGEGRVVWSEDLVSVSDAMNALRKVPGVDAAPVRHGYWIIRRFGDRARCSICDMAFADAYDLEDYDHYCRHCGAVMESIKMGGKDET